MIERLYSFGLETNTLHRNIEIKAPKTRENTERVGESEEKGMRRSKQPKPANFGWIDYIEQINVLLLAKTFKQQFTDTVQSFFPHVCVFLSINLFERFYLFQRLIQFLLFALRFIFIRFFFCWCHFSRNTTNIPNGSLTIAIECGWRKKRNRTYVEQKQNDNRSCWCEFLLKAH